MKSLLKVLILFIAINASAQSQGLYNTGKITFGGEGLQTLNLNIGEEGIDKPSQQWDPNAVLIFNAIDSLGDAATESEKERINSFVLYLKNTGDWDKIVACWGMATETQTAAVLNWKHPGTFTLSLVNSPTFTTKEGFNGNGTSSYLNTNWIANSHGAGIYLQNDAGITIYTRTSGTSTGNIVGVVGASNVRSLAFLPKYTDNNLYNRTNNVNTSFYSTANATAEAIYTILRTSNTAVTVYRNSVSLGTQSIGSDGLPLLTLYIGATNVNGTPNFYTNRQISFLIIHSGSISPSNIQTAVETFMDSNGKGVIP